MPKEALKSLPYLAHDYGIQMLNLERPQCPTFDKEMMPHVGKALPSVSSGLELGLETTALDLEHFSTE